MMRGLIFSGLKLEVIIEYHIEWNTSAKENSV
jgi:hypothetical protein